MLWRPKWNRWGKPHPTNSTLRLRESRGCAVTASLCLLPATFVEARAVGWGLPHQFPWDCHESLTRKALAAVVWWTIHNYRCRKALRLHHYPAEITVTFCCPERL